MNSPTIHATFLRHAQTEYNVQKRCNDDPSVPVPLTAHGKEHATGIAQLLENETFDVIFVSRFTRTIETARILNKPHNAPVFVDTRLDERKTGFEGRQVAEFKAAVAHDPVHGKRDDGESFAEIKRRTRSFLDDLRHSTYRHVLVVTHHDPLRAILGYLDGLEDAEALCLSIDNCEGFRALLPREGDCDDLKPLISNSLLHGADIFINNPATPATNGSGTGPRGA